MYALTVRRHDYTDTTGPDYFSLVPSRIDIDQAEPRYQQMANALHGKGTWMVHHLVGSLERNRLTSNIPHQWTMPLQLGHSSICDSIIHTVPVCSLMGDADTGLCPITHILEDTTTLRCNLLPVQSPIILDSTELS